MTNVHAHATQLAAPNNNSTSPHITRHYVIPMPHTSICFPNKTYPYTFIALLRLLLPPFLPLPHVLSPPSPPLRSKPHSRPLV